MEITNLVSIKSNENKNPGPNEFCFPQLYDEKESIEWAFVSL